MDAGDRSLCLGALLGLAWACVCVCNQTFLLSVSRAPLTAQWGVGPTHPPRAWLNLSRCAACFVRVRLLLLLLLLCARPTDDGDAPPGDVS
jgi:hypothetical protein